MARSAPMASAVRSVSWQACGPQETTTISLAAPASFRRTASSTAISSKGFIDILTFAVSTPLPSPLTRTLTLKSTTRLTLTRTFIGAQIIAPAPFRSVVPATLHESVHRDRALAGFKHDYRVDVDRSHAAVPPQHRLAKAQRH